MLLVEAETVKHEGPLAVQRVDQFVEGIQLAPVDLVHRAALVVDAAVAQLEQLTGQGCRLLGGDGLAVHAHMPGLDESLRFGPRFDQSRSHEHHVKSVKWSRGIDMLLGHISSFRPTIHQRGGSAWSHHPALHVIFRWRENESPLLAAAVIKLVL